MLLFLFILELIYVYCIVKRECRIKTGQIKDSEDKENRLKIDQERLSKENNKKQVLLLSFSIVAKIISISSRLTFC